MKQISIIDLINRRRIFTFGSLVLVVLILGSILLMKNPGRSEAAGWNERDQIFTFDNTCSASLLTTDASGNTSAICYDASLTLARALFRKDFAPNERPNVIIHNAYVIARSPAGISTNLGYMELRNGGSLGHESIRVADINTTPPLPERTSMNYLLPSGQAKKVDLNLTGNLTIDGTSRIDVSERGFPGGQAGSPTGTPDSDLNWESDWGTNTHIGFGPGGSLGYRAGNQNWVMSAGASGRGLGGAGAANCCYHFNLVRPVINNPPEGWWGSGSGAAFNSHDSNPNVDGSPGGGWVKIVANSINSNGGHIIANGSHGMSNGGAFGGGGAGGTISIKLKGPDRNQAFNIGQEDANTSTLAVRGGTTTRRPDDDTSAISKNYNGKAGSMYFSSSLYVSGPPVNGLNLEAIGGGIGNGGGGGSGGNISVLDISGNTSLSIKKKLVAVGRQDGATSLSNNFNPYALQVGDVIKVEITATQITSPATVSDKYLMLGGATSYALADVKCVPSNASGEAGQPSSGVTQSDGAEFDSISGGTINWIVRAGTTQTSFDFSYHCKVTKR